VSARDLGACRSLIDDAARTLAQCDVELGDPGADLQQVEKWLLDSLNLVLHSLALLRGGPRA
jgi:hypothetical protein